MNFNEKLFDLMKRVASIEIAQGSVRINEEGLFELGVLAVCDGDISPIGSIAENATETEFAQLEMQLDLLENAVRAEQAEDERRMAAVREVLNKLTREERILIDRPLPEEMLPDDDGDPEGYC